MTLADDIKRLATDLAKTGLHFDCVAIEAQLAADGYPESYVVLWEPEFRAMVNTLCRQSQREPDSLPDTSI